RGRARAGRGRSPRRSAAPAGSRGGDGRLLLCLSRKDNGRNLSATRRSQVHRRTVGASMLRGDPTREGLTRGGRLATACAIASVSWGLGYADALDGVLEVRAAYVNIGKGEAWPIVVEPQLDNGNYTISVRAGVRRGRLPASLRAILFWANDWVRVSEWYSWVLPV